MPGSGSGDTRQPKRQRYEDQHGDHYGPRELLTSLERIDCNAEAVGSALNRNAFFLWLYPVIRCHFRQRMNSHRAEVAGGLLYDILLEHRGSGSGIGECLRGMVQLYCLYTTEIEAFARTTRHAIYDNLFPSALPRKI